MAWERTKDGWAHLKYEFRMYWVTWALDKIVYWMPPEHPKFEAILQTTIQMAQLIRMDLEDG